MHLPKITFIASEKNFEDLEVLSFALSKDNTIDPSFYLEKYNHRFWKTFFLKTIHERKEAFDTFFKEIYTPYIQKQQWKSVKEINSDISKIIKNSQFEPFSYWFIKDIYREIFPGCNMMNSINIFDLDDIRYIRSRLQAIIYDFFENYTNIDAVINAFVKHINTHKGHMFILERQQSQIFRFLYFYIKYFRKDIFKEYFRYKPLFLDQNFSFFNKKEKALIVNRKKRLPYVHSFPHQSNLY